LLYIPINRFITGGWALSLPIDNSIPLLPPALIPYLFASLLFIVFPIWVAIYSKPKEFETYLISILFAAVISKIIYIVLPTFVIRPEITTEDFFSKAIILLYQNDYPNNAAPSGHTFYTLISFLYLRNWKRSFWLLWLIALLIILASTLLTKQHYVLDIVTGLILGFIAYHFGRYVQNKFNLQFASKLYSSL
jgi:membrane-associated phospholipid phosphatase